MPSERSGKIKENYEWKVTIYFKFLPMESIQELSFSHSVNCTLIVTWWLCVDIFFFQIILFGSEEAFGTVSILERSLVAVPIL